MDQSVDEFPIIVSFHSLTPFIHSYVNEKRLVNHKIGVTGVS